MTEVYQWPSELPHFPLVGTWTSQVQLNDVEAPSDVGQGDIRSRSTSQSEVVSFSMLMDSTQLKIFKYFYKNTLRGRVYPFRFQHPEEDDVREFRFYEAYQARHKEDKYYQVDFTLITKAE